MWQVGAILYGGKVKLVVRGSDGATSRTLMDGTNRPPRVRQSAGVRLRHIRVRGTGSIPVSPGVTQVGEVGEVENRIHLAPPRPPPLQYFTEQFAGNVPVGDALPACRDQKHLLTEAGLLAWIIDAASPVALTPNLKVLPDQV